MKHLLLTTIAAVVLVGCCTTPSLEPPTAKAPEISIHDAAMKGNIEAVKQHLAAGWDVNAKNKSGYTALHHAKTKEIVELLIAKGADINAKADYGETPLYSAIIHGHTEITELLIAKGADVNAKYKHLLGTPLHAAVFDDLSEIAELLIAAGADVNAITDEGDSVLDWNYAEESRREPEKKLGVQFVTLLRKHGAKSAEELKAEGK